MQKPFKVLLIAAILGGLLVGALGSFLYFYFQEGLEARPELVSTTPPATGLEPEDHGNLTIYRDPAVAFEEATAKGEPVFIDFYADWCANCVKFQTKMLEDSQLNEALSHAIVLKVDEMDTSFEHYAREGRFQELNESLPLFAVLTPGNELIWKGQDYLDTRSMIQALNEARP